MSRPSHPPWTDRTINIWRWGYKLRRTSTSETWHEADHAGGQMSSFFNDNRKVTSFRWRNHRHLISSQLSTKQFLTRGQVTLMAMTFHHFTLFVNTAAHVLYFQLHRWTAKCLAVQHLPRYASRQATSDTDRTYLTFWRLMSTIVVVPHR